MPKTKKIRKNKKSLKRKNIIKNSKKTEKTRKKRNIIGGMNNRDFNILVNKCVNKIKINTNNDEIIYILRRVLNVNNSEEIKKKISDKLIKEIDRESLNKQEEKFNKINKLLDDDVNLKYRLINIIKSLLQSQNYDTRNLDPNIITIESKEVESEPKEELKEISKSKLRKLKNKQKNDENLSLVNPVIEPIIEPVVEPVDEPGEEGEEGNTVEKEGEDKNIEGEVEDGEGEVEDGEEKEGEDGEDGEGEGEDGDGEEGDGEQGDEKEGDGEEGDGEQGDEEEGDGEEGDGEQGDEEEGDGEEGDEEEGDEEEGDGEEGDEEEGDGEEEKQGEEKQGDFLSSIFDEPDLEEETRKIDEYLSSVKDDPEEETGKFDEYLLSIFDEPVLNDTESPVILDDPGEDNFTSTVFDDTFPKEPSGFKKKIIKPKITEDEKIKNMSEIMKKFFEYRRKQKLRELLKNRILREIEGRYDEGKKQNLLSKLNNVIKNDNDMMINKINGLNQEERNNFNEDIKASLAPMEQTDITDQIDKDTNNLIDEFDSNEPDNNSFEYINDKFNNFGLKLKPKLIKSKIRETYDISNDKISQIMKMIIELEKMRKLDNLYKMKIKKLTDENLNIEEIEKYKNKKKNLDILYLNFPDNINKKIDELTDEEKKILEEEIKKYLLDDLINNEIDEDTNNLIDEFESNEPDDNFFEYLKTKFPEKEFNIRPKPINSKIRESHEILNDKISQIMKMIIELEKTRKINNLYDRKIKKINQQLSNIQNKISTLNPLNENVEVMRNQIEVKDLTQKYNQYNKKQKYIIEKINLISKKLNSKIDELNDEEKKILEEEIKKYLSLEEYSMSNYLYDKYKEITENIKKWIEFTGTSIRNQIELNDWMKKLKNLEEENKTTQTDENLKIIEEIKKITDSLKDGIKESKTKIVNLISQMTEKEKNDIEIMEEDINKKKMDNMKNKYMNALRLVQNIESGILSLSS
jgi:hypothetical protein